MKKKRILFYLPWLLVVALCMPLVGCSGDDDDSDLTPDNQDTPKPEREKVFKTFTFDYFKQDGQYLVGYPDNHPSCFVIWGSKGASFMVYLVQDDKIINAGWAHSNDTILTEEECKSKALSFDVEIPTNINRDMPIDMIALNGVESTLSNGKIVCKTDLRRGGSFSLWDHSGSKAGAGIGRSYSLTTIETVKIYNTTSETITVKHKGFDAKDKWYYSKANVTLTADMMFNNNNIQGSTVNEEVFSDAIEVAPGDDYGIIWSYYVPTGKKMTDASLVLEINGKDVRTPPISSEANFVIGGYYTMAVSWDGHNLKWEGIASENKDVPAEAIDLALPSGTYWASYNVGATKPEEVGGYYAWGETETKDSYTWSNYIHCDGSESTCHNIGDDIGGTNYDVANVKWGGGWRMPSLEQWQEVITSCSYETTTINGVNGLRLTSRKNGNSIFLPLTGAKWDTGCYYTENIYGWLSSLNITGTSYANYLTYQSMGIGHGRDFERFYGLPIRPVLKSPQKPDNHTGGSPSDGH